MDFNPGRGLASDPAGAGGRVRFVNPPRTLPMWIDQVSSTGPRAPLLYRWIPLAQIPEIFLKHLWISEDQRFFQHEGGVSPQDAKNSQASRLLTPQRRRSFRQRYLEFDLGELLGGLAYLAQEGEPARVGVDLVEEGVRDDLGEAGIFIFNCLVQPLEGLVRVAPKGVDEGDNVGSILLVFRDRRRESGIRVGLRPSAW